LRITKTGIERIQGIGVSFANHYTKPMRKTLFFRLSAMLALCSLLSQCQRNHPLPETVADYFPHPAFLQKGIAQKYYFHYQRPDQSEIWTNINYLTYQIDDQQELVITNYDADFTPNRLRRVVFDQGAMKVLEDVQYDGADTTQSAMLQPTMRNWLADTATLIKENKTGDLTIQSTEQQIQRKDTLIENRPGVIFYGQYEATRYAADDTTSFSNTFTETYVEGLGLYHQHFQSDRFQGTLELIAQMSMPEFRKQQQHGLERVAYIDPGRTLGYRPDFELCTATEAIIDYYNADPDIHYRGGKYALWKAIRPQLEPTMLENASGYLTFRFVINCEGEAGRFTLEPADLDFQPTQFPEKTVAHLGEITAGLTDWRPGRHKGEPADAYAYLTYKLKDGELVELLP
jgi:hypothetical protein